MTIDFIISFIINLLCHVFILVTFLTILFFMFIAPLEVQNIDDNMKSIVQPKTTLFMQTIDADDTKKQINWKNVENVSNRLAQQCQDNLASITYSNQNLYDSTICFLMIYAMLIILLVCYFMFRSVQLNLRFIVLENFVIFALVGMVEIYFFVNIASKYVPVMPSVALTAFVDRLNNNLSQ